MVGNTVASATTAVIGLEVQPKVLFLTVTVYEPETKFPNAVGGLGTAAEAIYVLVSKGVVSVYVYCCPFLRFTSVLVPVTVPL